MTTEPTDSDSLMHKLLFKCCHKIKVDQVCTYGKIYQTWPNCFVEKHINLNCSSPGPFVEPCLYFYFNYGLLEAKPTGGL